MEFRKLKPKSDAAPKDADKKDDDKPFADVIKGLEPVTNGLFRVYQATNDPTGSCWRSRPINWTRCTSSRRRRSAGPASVDCIPRKWAGTSPVPSVGSANRSNGSSRIRCSPRTPEHPPSERSKSFGDSLAGTVKILSAPHPERRSILVDAENFS